MSQAAKYTIPNKSMRTARLTNLVFGLVLVGIAAAFFTGNKIVSAIFGVVGLVALVRVFILPSEYRKKPKLLRKKK